LRNLTGCSAVGIRMKASPGGHQALDGFDPDYLDVAECRNVGGPQCLCLRVLTGTLDFGLKRSREGGTCYSNSAARFRNANTGDALQNAPLIFTRFESAALVPIRSGDTVLGLMHFADRQRGKLSAGTLHLLETAALQLALGAERILAEDALSQCEVRSRALMDTMTEGLAVTDANFVLIYANPRICSLTGYSEEEIIGRRVSDLVEEDSLPALKMQFDRLQHGESEPFETVGIRKDGHKLTVLVSPKPVFDGHGRFAGGVAVVTDLTRLKDLELSVRQSEAQLRALSSGLLKAQEEERWRISRELHDDLAQALTSTKLQLGYIRKNLPRSRQFLREECDIATRQLGRVLEEVRGLSAGLSPVIVEDLGFSAALHWLVDGFAKLNNIRVTLSADDIEPLLSRDTCIMLYRIFQEALTNIGKHADAKSVSVTISRRDSEVFIEIEDDGTGFSMGGLSPDEPGGLGLAAMKERVRMLGGRLDIWSERDKGTRLSFALPMSNLRTT